MLEGIRMENSRDFLICCKRIQVEEDNGIFLDKLKLEAEV